jgi:hypothetical protein
VVGLYSGVHERAGGGGGDHEKKLGGGEGSWEEEGPACGDGSRGQDGPATGDEFLRQVESARPAWGVGVLGHRGSPMAGFSVNGIIFQVGSGDSGVSGHSSTPPGGIIYDRTALLGSL